MGARRGSRGITPRPKNSDELRQSGLVVSLASRIKPQYAFRIRAITGAPAFINFGKVPSRCQRWRLVRRLRGLPYAGGNDSKVHRVASA